MGSIGHFSCVQAALQADLNTLRADYEKLGNHFKEYKAKHHHQSSLSADHGNKASHQASPQSNPLGALAAKATSPFTHHLQQQQQQINQENESLEEDMRKAKESADMLRSVVLPLETEISTLRSRSNTSDKRIKELELLVEQVRLMDDYSFDHLIYP